VHSARIPVAQDKGAGRSEVAGVVAKVGTNKPKRLPKEEVNPKGRSKNKRRRAKPGDYSVLVPGRSEELRQDMRIHGLRVAVGGFK